MDALSPRILQAVRQGRVNLDDPAVTLALLDANAVVGVKGFRGPDGRLGSVGLQCAFCHSTVDDALAPGVGHRLDGWPNRDLNVGAIVALAPDLSAIADLLDVDEGTVRKVLASWGPGRFDAHLFLDGKPFRPDGRTAAVLIPAAFGLAGVNLTTYTGWGGISHWNAFVANLEMHGQGTFVDPRLNDETQFPVAARAGFGNVRNDPDLITSKLPRCSSTSCRFRRRVRPTGPTTRGLAEQGRRVFNGAARCATCHVPPIYTEPGWNLHTAAEIGIDDFQAAGRPSAATGRLPSGACSPGRRAASITTGVSPISERSSITTTGRSRSTWRRGKRRR